MQDDLSSYLVYFLAFLFVLALIGVMAWLFKSMTGGRGNNGGGRLFGGREKRIGIVQAASVDGRRKLILIRRDDKEHLIMVGGPVDMLIENGIDSPGALSERRTAREAYAASSDFDDLDAVDSETYAEPEPSEGAAQKDTPKRRISLTMRSEQSKGDKEP